MTSFPPHAECEVVRECEADPAVYALFNGSLSFACATHAREMIAQYDAVLYDDGLDEAPEP